VKAKNLKYKTKILSSSYLIYFCLKNAIDKALYKANTAILVGTSTWLEQFKQAFNVKSIEKKIEDFQIE
jgi:hypothetical protein